MCLLQIIGGKFENKTINSVSDNLLRAGEMLRDINPKRGSCLTTFTKCFDLVTWLRDSIKGNEPQDRYVFYCIFIQVSLMLSCMNNLLHHPCYVPD